MATNLGTLIAGADADMEVLERRLGPVAAKLDERLALNELTGPEVLRFMNALGINIPANRMGKTNTHDPVVEAYRRKN